MADISNNGERFVVVNPDHLVTVFDSTGKTRLELPHQSPVTNVLLSPYGRSLITAENDRLTIWDCDSKSRITELIDQNFFLDGFNFSPDGKMIAISKGNTSIYVLDATTGERTHEFSDPRISYISLAFNNDGSLLAAGAAGGKIGVWDLGDDRSLDLEFGHPVSERVNGIRFDPDGRTLLSFSSDQTARTWHIDSRTPGHILHHNDFVSDGAFSPDGKMIVTGSHDTRARVWDAQTGKLLFEPFVHSSGIEHVSFDALSQRVISFCYGGTVWMWEILEAPFAPSLIDAGGPVGIVKLSPDGSSIACSQGDTVRIWNTATAEQSGAPLNCNRFIADLSFSPDGRYIAAASEIEARVWEVATGAPVSTTMVAEKGIVSISFSPDSTRLLVPSADAARLIDVTNGELAGALMKSTQDIISACYSPNGHRILTVSGPGEAMIWNTADQSVAITLPNNAYADLGSVFTPDGASIITVHGMKLRLWDAETGIQTAYVPHDSQATEVIYNRAGTRLAIAAKDGVARLWDMQAEPSFSFGIDEGSPGVKPVQSYPHKARIYDVEFSPDNNDIVTASADRSARIWDVPSGRPVTGRLKHEAEVITAQFSPDGMSLMTASLDGQVKIWPLVPVPEGADAWLSELAEFVAGGKIDSADHFKVFDAEEAMLRRETLSSIGPPKGDSALFDWYVDDRD